MRNTARFLAAVMSFVVGTVRLTRPYYLCALARQGGTGRWELGIAGLANRLTHPKVRKTRVSASLNRLYVA